MNCSIHVDVRCVDVPCYKARKELEVISGGRQPLTSGDHQMSDSFLAAVAR